HLHRRRQHSKPAPPVETPALLRRPSMAHRHISLARPGLPTPNLLRRRKERPSPARVETTSGTVSPGGELRAVAPRLVFGRPSACLHAPSSAPAAAPSGFPPRPRADSRRGPGWIPAAAPGGFAPVARADSRRGPGGFAPVARADSRRWEEQRPRLPWVRPNSPLAPVGGILTTRRRKPVAG